MNAILQSNDHPAFRAETLRLKGERVSRSRSLEVFERYVDEMYRNMWADPKKMDDPNVSRAALDEAGLPTAKILELIETKPVKDELLENTNRSVERGTFGSPTFYVGNDIFFGKDRLRDVEKEIAAGAPA